MKNNTEHIEGLWTFENPKSIKLNWGEFPFNTMTSIIWRGLLIHIRVKTEKQEFGWTIVITFLYQNKLYHCKLTKYKGNGGRHGDNPPEVATATHNLQIRMFGPSGLTLNDELIESNKNIEISENPFVIIKTTESSIFDNINPEVTKEPVKLAIKKNEVKLAIKKNEVTLYEYKDHRISINSYAYFDEDNLVVDYWTLSDKYEDEYFTRVKKENLNLLYREFEIDKENEAELLIALRNAFKGENCYDKIKEFFIQKNIPFLNSVQHDEN